MSNLTDIRANIFYRKKDEQYQKVTELILLSTKPNYKYVADKVIKDLDVVECRFELTENQFDALIETLRALKDITEKDLS